MSERDPASAARASLGRRPLLLAGVGLAGCSSPAPTPAAPAAPPVQRGPVIDFSYESLDDRPVSREALKGRAALVVFLATYGDASLLQARYAKKTFKEHSPRINAAAVFLEPPDNRPLVRVFRDSADLPFPSAMGDLDTIAGRGPFRAVGVPGVVILDHEGHEMWRKLNVATSDELHKALREAQRGVWG